MRTVIGILAILTCSLVRCGSLTSLAGGSTNTGNGLIAGFVSRPDGAPASSVVMKLLPSDYDPSADDSRSAVMTATTDESGGYRFGRVRSGTYAIEGWSAYDGTRLLIRGICVGPSSDSVTPPAGTLRPAGALVVRLPQAFDTTGGYLYVSGTSRFSSVFQILDSMLCAVIDSIPATELPPVYFAKRHTAAPPVLMNNRVAVAPGCTSIVAGLADATGYPDETTTGPAAGGYTNLEPVAAVDIYAGSEPSFAKKQADGWLLIEGKSFDRTFQVYRDSVIIRGCRIVAADSLMPAIYLQGGGGYVVEYCDIHAPNLGTELHYSVSSGADDITIRCNNFASWGIGVLLGGANVTIENNYIHSPAPLGTNAIAHLGNGKGLLFRHNTLENSNTSTSCIALFQDGTAGRTGYNDVLADDNWAAGGGYTFYCGFEKVMDPLYNVRFTNNKLSVKFYRAGGYYGPATSAPAWGSDGNVWSGNIWVDGPNAGTAISPP